MELMSMCLDAFSIIEDLINPVSPGHAYIKCGRLAINTFYILTGKLGFRNPLADQIMLCIDLLTALEELDATEWEGRDEASTLPAGTDNLLEVLTAIGYFTAFTSKEKAPHAAAVGLFCMQVAGAAAVAKNKYR